MSKIELPDIIFFTGFGFGIYGVAQVHTPSAWIAAGVVLSVGALFMIRNKQRGNPNG